MTQLNITFDQREILQMLAAETQALLQARDIETKEVRA